jgi:hypothetical protein
VEVKLDGTKSQQMFCMHDVLYGWQLVWVVDRSGQKKILAATLGSSTNKNAPSPLPSAMDDNMVWAPWYTSMM